MDETVCSDHPQVRATRFKFIFKNNTKRFKDYDLAVQCLSGPRFKTVEGMYDERDYQAWKPLSFSSWPTSTCLSKRSP